MSDAVETPEKRDASGLSVKLTFDLPYFLALEDGEYAIRIGGLNASIRVKRIPQATLDPRLNVTRSVGMSISHDRHGWLQYSRLEVSMPVQHVIDTETRRQVALGNLHPVDGNVDISVSVGDLGEKFEETAIQEARTVTNHFLSLYRNTTGEYHVRRLSDEDISWIQVGWYHGDEWIEGSSLSRFGQGLTLEPIGFTEEAMVRFREALTTGLAAPIVAELLNDARDHLDVGDYRLAAIDARTGLEVLVDETLLDYFASSGQPLADFCKLLDVKYDAKLTIADVLQKASINNKLKKGLRSAIKLDLPKGHPGLWSQWFVAKQLRDGAAHRGAAVSREEAIAAVNTIGVLVGKIISLLRNPE